VAGEASGDMYGALLVSEMRKLAPEVTFFGIGGPRMEKAGVQIICHAAGLMVVGMTEVIPKARLILRTLRRLKDALRTHPPDIVILIDYPGFNLNLAKKAHDLGIPVLYYIPPQVWAWWERRVKKIAKRVDRVAVILPFEKEFYFRHGISVEYVGHPLMDGPLPWRSKQEIRAGLAIDSERGPVLGLLPGSRNEEIARHMPLMVGAAEILSRSYPGLYCIIPLASTVREEVVEPYLKDARAGIVVRRSDTKETLKACDLALVVSGTATLEAAITETPMVILYKVSPLTYMFSRALAKVPHIGLANLVAGREIVPELIQSEATDTRLAEEGIRILEDENVSREMRKNLRLVCGQLGHGGASTRAASIAGEMMGLQV
jgi:lipid-A-disaccharide synthase